MLKRLSDDNIYWSFHMILHEVVYVHLTYPRCSSLFQRNIQRTNFFKISHSSWGLPRSTLQRKNTNVSSVLCISFQKIIKFIKDYKICQSIDCLRSCAMSAVFQLSEREIMVVLFSGQLVKGVSTHLKPKYQRCLQRASWRCRVIQPIKKMCSRTNSDVIPLFCVFSGLNTTKLYKWHKFLSVVKKLGTENEKEIYQLSF